MYNVFKSNIATFQRNSIWQEIRALVRKKSLVQMLVKFLHNHIKHASTRSTCCLQRSVRFMLPLALTALTTARSRVKSTDKSIQFLFSVLELVINHGSIRSKLAALGAEKYVKHVREGGIRRCTLEHGLRSSLPV